MPAREGGFNRPFPRGAGMQRHFSYVERRENARNAPRSDPIHPQEWINQRVLRGRGHGGRAWRHAAIRVLSLVAVLSLLAACATRPAPPATGWETHARWAGEQSRFMLLGKLGTPSGSANLRWEQWENRFSIRLWGPMGQATTLITGDVRRVVLERADGGERRVGDPAVILKEELGWEIPVGALGYWVRGVPARDGAATNLQLSEGRAAAFGQNGWHIEVSRYMAVAGRSLPARITAARGEHRVTLSSANGTWATRRGTART